MKIKVLYCIETLKSGGVEQRRYTLSKLLNKDKFEIKIICTQTSGPLADQIRNEGVEVLEVGILKKVWDLKVYISVLKIIRSFKPDIIHGAVFEGVLLATIGGSLGRVPAIIAEETSAPKDRSRKASLLLKCLSKLSNVVISVSPAVYNYLELEAGISPHKIRLINNGVMLPDKVETALVRNLSVELDIREGDYILGSVGRLWNDVKRFTDLIDAVAILKDKQKNLKLIIVGDGPDRVLLKEYIKEKHLSDRVIMVGFQPDPHPYYELMDAFAIVSHTEAFGLAAVEAMFHRLPVIASKVGGLVNIVNDRETGLLVDAHSPEQVVDAINFLMFNETKSRMMGENGYRRAVQEYSAQRYVNDVQNLYKEILDSKGIIR